MPSFYLASKERKLVYLYIETGRKANDKLKVGWVKAATFYHLSAAIVYGLLGDLQIAIIPFHIASLQPCLQSMQSKLMLPAEYVCQYVSCNT